ncbi:hypothetical protein DBR06_SOUSAS310065, partial [Sousa chinensis]
QSCLHIFVPQTIDEGVEHRSHDTIEERDDFVCDLYFVCTREVFSFEFCIREEDGSIEYNHHCEVGRAGGKDFVPSLCRRNPQDGGENENIGNKNEKYGNQKKNHNSNNHANNIYGDISTGQF